MELVENIAMWSGLAGAILAIVTIIILFLIRGNIADIIDKNAILFEQNFKMKKTAIENCINLADYLVEYGVEVITNKTFKSKCKAAYNEMICLIEDTKLIDMFYDLCLNETRTFVSDNEVSKFKNLCRKELGYKKLPNSYFGAGADFMKVSKPKSSKKDKI